MAKHKVGNCYKFSGHILELQEIFNVPGISPRRGCKLDCQPGCCTPPYGFKIECHLGDLDDMELVKEVDIVAVSEIDWQKGDVAEVKEGWGRAGTKFNVLGPAVFQLQWWVPIEDPDEDDPDFFKEAGLRKVQ